jgi:sRNA-binding carbon storage regulator CsrA
MLMLTRRVGESFVILPTPGLDLTTPVGALFRSGPIHIAVAQVAGARVKFGVAADDRLLILREELRRRVE